MPTTYPSPLIVIVDDERTFDTDLPVVYLRSADEALLWFARWITDYYSAVSGAESRITEVWFDHDLGDGDDALVVAKFLAAVDWAQEGIDVVFVHSQNPVGASNIVDTLRHGFPGKVCRSGLPDLK